jgi:predicted transposase YdaD
VKEGLDGDAKRYTRYTLLAELIAACLDEQTLQEIEDEMELQSTAPFSKWARKHFFEGEDKGRQEGQQEGLRRAIALVLESRGLALSVAQQERLARCTNDAQLEAWLRRAGVVPEVDQVFEV